MSERFTAEDYERGASLLETQAFYPEPAAQVPFSLSAMLQQAADMARELATARETMAKVQTLANEYADADNCVAVHSLARIVLAMLSESTS